MPIKIFLSRKKKPKQGGGEGGEKGLWIPEDPFSTRLQGYPDELIPRMKSSERKSRRLVSSGCAKSSHKVLLNILPPALHSPPTKAKRGLSNITIFSVLNRRPPRPNESFKRKADQIIRYITKSA